LRWIAENQEVITALTGVGTLLVWVIYLQVFVSSYRRQLRATLLVTRGAGDGLEARCFVSNMSSGPVYVQSVLVRLETRASTLISPVTDLLDLEGETPAEPMQRTRQGPLASGEIRDIGSFRNLMQHVLRANLQGPDLENAPETVRSISVEVIGIYGSEDLPIGARRRFVVLNHDGRIWVKGEELETRQIRSKRERRRLVADLERDR
jgi:hypothetical protein